MTEANNANCRREGANADFKIEYFGTFCGAEVAVEEILEAAPREAFLPLIFPCFETQSDVR